MIDIDNYVDENKNWTKWQMAIYTGSSAQLIKIDVSGSGKTNALINLINGQNDIDKMYLYARDLSEPKYEYLIEKREDAGMK